MEEDHGSRCEEFDREEASFDSSEDSEELLESEDDKNHKTGDEGPDCSSRIPCPSRTAECERHYEGGIETCVQECADPIELLQFRESGDSGLRLSCWDEDECWSHYSKNNEVNIECLEIILSAHAI